MTGEGQPRRLDTLSYVPLYMQLATVLREQIRDGQLKEGDQLPSEPALSRAYGVSRATAIAALDELVAANEAYRVRGRGSYVARKLISRFSLATGFTDAMIEKGLTPSSVVLDLATSTPSAAIALKLDAPRDLGCYRLVRLRLADGEPVALQTAYLPADLYPSLSAEMFDGKSLYEVMRTNYSHSPTWAEAIVEARQTSAEEASRLRISTKDPVLVVWHLALDDSLQPLEYVHSAYRADRFSFASGRQAVEIQPSMTPAALTPATTE